MAMATVASSHVPMPAMSMPMPVAVGAGPTIPTQTGPVAPGSGGGGLTTASLWEGSARGPEDAVAIGIDLGCANVRVAMWSAEDGCAVPVAVGDPSGDDDTLEDALRCCVAFPSANKAVVGEAALNATDATPLIGVQRLLGRKYASLDGAKWLEREAEQLVGCSLVPSDEPGGDVRLKMTFSRPKASGLKKRGASQPAGQPDKDKARSATVDRILGPEEIVYRVLQQAKARAEAQIDAEVTHATLVVPAH